jgi:hypothetical protein
MTKWQVTYYKRENTPAITKTYANLNSASLAVEKLRQRGIGAELSPLMEQE